MSHILKKLQIAGAKKKQKPKPPIYKPPTMGELQYGASFSYAETLDLISDGPVEGLVSPRGEVMEGINILRGIYLNDTAVAISNDSTPNSDIDNQGLEGNAMALSTDSAAGIISFRNFFRGITQQATRSRDGRISTLSHNSGTVGALNGWESYRSPHIPFMFLKIREYDARRSRGRGGSGEPTVAPGWAEASYYFRAFIQDGISTQSFHWYLDGTLNYGGAGDSAGNAAFRDDRFPRGGHGYSTKGLGSTRPQSMYWTDENTLAASKFFLGVGHSKYGYLGNFTHTSDYAEELIRDDLKDILALWNNSRDENNPDTFNPYQRDLAAKALTNLGWNSAGDTSDIFGLLSAKLDVREAMFAIIKVGEEGNPNLKKDIRDLNRDAVDGRYPLLNMGTVLYGATEGWDLETALNGAWGFHVSRSKTDVTCPEIDVNGVLTGNMHGFILLSFHLTSVLYDPDRNDFRSYTAAFAEGMNRLFASVESLQYTHEAKGDVTPVNSSQVSSNLKFNYTNVLAEFEEGEEDQQPLESFRRIFIDHIYNKELFGPFTTAASTGDTRTQGDQVNAPQRIHPSTEMLTRSEVLGLGADNFNVEMEGELPIDEGSDDQRYSGGDKNYSTWGVNSLVSWNERALPCTHTVYNPNVTQAFITLNITSLQDTLVANQDNVGGDSQADLKVGAKFPTVLNIRVETGTVGKYKNSAEGGENVVNTYTFRIVALIEGQTLIDIGNPDNTSGPSNRDFIVSLNEGRTNLSIPFQLPSINEANVEEMDDDLASGSEAGVIDKDSVEKRFIRVTKLSHESNSVLISKVVALNKVTEIIEVDLPYPFSAIVGTKVDSRAFGSIPNRTYDCKLKKVKIPNNYFPTIDGKDKRYYETTQEFRDATANKKLVYEGDWNGSFHTDLRWTDNPAWILYDLLTNNRYGMGNHIDANKINKWQLYKIGRFCDAVDDNGYFEGVTDGRGGLEPRFSCNIVFDKGQKIYDAINTISEIFRGRVFFGSSAINFVDDRPREPINLFTNESVKDGQFFYSNNRRDQQYNTIEVSFKDRFDNFSPKIEVIEDEEDIKERGAFKTRIEGVGITSRAMARRVGQHTIFSSIDENQTVAFTAGLESLLCLPGDLVTIEDELKTNKANFGKILDVDPANEIIRLSNSFVGLTMNNTLTVYIPTGRDTIEYTNEFAGRDRTRYEGFTVTGKIANVWSRYTGDYAFSGYTSGYDVSREDNDFRFQQYGLYTGVSGTFLYFETGVTGWTFASGTGAGNVGAFDLASGDFIQELTGAQTLFDFNTGKISAWTEIGTHRGGPVYDFSGFDSDSFIGPYEGVLNSEIAEASPNQMAVFSITGYVWSSPSDLELRGFNPYGTVVSGVDKPHLLPFVKLGSPAKFEIKDASPFIYKVIAMKENAPNEYLISATKYDTGKYNLIDNNISIENKADTYSYQVAQTINGITYSGLNAPVLHSLTTGVPDAATDTFSITGMWSAVTEGTGYNVRLTQPNGLVRSEFVTTTGHKIENLSQVGVFNFCVSALGDNGRRGGANAFFDSAYDCSGMFVVYDELLVFNRSFVNQITIL